MVGSRSSLEVKSSRASAAWGLAPEAAGDEHPEALLDGAVLGGAGRGDDADVVEHGLAAVGLAAREVDLELAGQALGEGVAQEVLEGGLGPRADVERLVGAGAGEVAAHHVADGVAARLAGREPDRGQQAHDLGDLLELHEVDLEVLAGGDVAPPPRVRLGDVGEHVELLGVDPAVGQLHPDHLVVAALALAVDAVVEAEDAEDVVADVAGEVALEHRLELGDVGGLAEIDLPLFEHAALPVSRVGGRPRSPPGALSSDRVEKTDQSGQKFPPLYQFPSGRLNIAGRIVLPTGCRHPGRRRHAQRSSSATRKARSRDWRALRRGSHIVS